MENENLAAVLHQFLLMLRDPVIYLAIDEKGGAFDEEESLHIRIAKARALMCVFKLEQSQDLAFLLNKELRDSSHPDLQVLNLLTLIRAHRLSGNTHSAASYAEEAIAVAGKCEHIMMKTMAECVQLSYLNSNAEVLESRAPAIAEQLNRADHPFMRLYILDWLGLSYSTLNKYDLSLSYYSAAYDLCNQHGLSVASLELIFAILDCCAHLQKHEIGEEFYTLGNKLISHLRLHIFEVQLNFYYAGLKYALKDYKAAVLFFQKSSQALLASEVKMPKLLFEIYNNLAKALNRLKMQDQALHYQLLAEKLLQDNGDMVLKVNLNANIALSQIGLQRWDDAYRRLRDAERFYRQHRLLEPLIKVTGTLAFYYQKRKDYLRAYVMMRRLDDLKSKQLQELRQTRSRMSEGRLKQILDDSKAIKTKYNKLLYEVSKRQTERFTGSSNAARRVLDSAVLASLHRDASVLILGESGTGKEVLARMIHYGSPQKNWPFISVNCATISPSMFEIEFFGSAPGKLTGISEFRQGFLEQAGQGTLFLDEISEIPIDFQAKLLGAIDTMSFCPVGKEEKLPIRCKIIAATNRDVLEMFKSNSFRVDLLHRLNTLEINIPPLRDRQEDIPLLVDQFAHGFAREAGKRLPQIRDSFYERLSIYDFPGNVRELKNIIERIFILYYEPIWSADILDNIDAFRRNKHLGGSLIEHNIKDLDKERIMEALRKTGGKQKTAAKLLNMSESTLCRKIKRYGIK